MTKLISEGHMAGVQWIRGIAHIGANIGQEVEAYAKLKDVPVILIEPNPACIPQIREEVARFNSDQFYIVETCCSDSNGEHVTFYVSPDRDAQSSSLLAPGAIIEMFPWMKDSVETKVSTTTLDHLLETTFAHLPINMLAIDTQGADLKVLRGAINTLRKCDGVYVEVSDQPLYHGGCTFKEIIDFMEEQGFGLYRSLVGPTGWGNALFRRRVSPNAMQIQELAERNVARGKPTSESSTHRRSQGANTLVDGDVARAKGYRSAAGRQDQWVEIDLEQPYEVAEIILVAPANGRMYENLQVLTRAQDGTWTIVYDYHAAGKALSRFDRIEVSGHIDAIRVESRASDMHMAQIMAIETQ